MEIKLSAIDLKYVDNVPTYKEDKIRSKAYIAYGSDNKWPDYLYSLYRDVSTLNTLINGSADYTAGNGVQEDYIVNNKIRTISLPLTIDTYLIKDANNVQNEEGTGSDGLNVILTEQVILDFFNSKHIEKEDIYNSEMEIFFRTYFTDEGYNRKDLVPPIPEP